MLKTADFIGLFPAAGHATRLGKPTHSKEIIEVPDLHSSITDSTVAVGDYLMRQFRAASITDIVVIRRKEKTDIYRHYSDDRYHDLTIHDLVIEPTPGTTHTLNAARALTRQRPVAMGFPDIIIDPPDILSALTSTLLNGDCELCLSLVPAGDPKKWDRVEYKEGRVTDITVKPGESVSSPGRSMSWGHVVWQPVFTQFLHDFLDRQSSDKEVYVGHVIQAAIESGMKVSAVPYPDGIALDIGTPDDLARAKTLSL